MWEGPFVASGWRRHVDLPGRFARLLDDGLLYLTFLPASTPFPICCGRVRQPFAPNW